MQPLVQLPPERLRALVGLCFDVDDTVTTGGLLDPAAYQSLFALRRAGLKLIAVTGRPLGFAEVIARSWPVDAAVGENGAGYLAKRDRELIAGFWDAADVRADQQQRLLALRLRVARELPEIQVSSDHWARRCDLAFDVGEQARVERARVEQLVALLAAEGARPTVSSIHAHAQFGDHDKAQGVARAAAALWSLSAEVVQRDFLFVGDSGNDAAAFSWFGLTAAVANVVHHLDRLPVAPQYCATLPYGEGFAQIAQAVLAARGQPHG